MIHEGMFEQIISRMDKQVRLIRALKKEFDELGPYDEGYMLEERILEAQKYLRPLCKLYIQETKSIVEE